MEKKQRQSRTRAQKDEESERLDVFIAQENAKIKKARDEKTARLRASRLAQETHRLDSRS